MSDTTEQKAWVVFTGKADLFWLKILKPGFRHCFVILNDGMRWISIDPLSNTMQVQVQNVEASFDFPNWLGRRGFHVAPAKLSQPNKPAPIGIFSCVEAVKRVLGIHRASIITPWQLYKFLQNHHPVIARSDNDEATHFSSRAGLLPPGQVRGCNDDVYKKEI